jgi:CO/xanthine dehydrogenase FAD-binding subunit
MQREANTLLAVDVLTPRTLEEALRLKAEQPAAVPIQGGTDVMVELNFDRANLGTSSPAGDALPPLLVCDARVRVASVRGERTLPLEEFVTGVKRNVLAEDELILDVTVEAGPGRQTFMKVGPRNAMVISVVSLALRADGDLTASFGSAGPVPGVVRAPLDSADSFPEQVAAAASPIDDVRGTAAYRRHALRVLTKRALERCLL